MIPRDPFGESPKVFIQNTLHAKELVHPLSIRNRSQRPAKQNSIEPRERPQHIPLTPVKKSLHRLSIQNKMTSATKQAA